MNSDVNRSSNYLPTAHYINIPRNIQDKLEHTIAIHTDLMDALMQHGYSGCIAILRDIVRKHNNGILTATHDNHFSQFKQKIGDVSYQPKEERIGDPNVSVKETGKLKEN
jgi:hypothetical protein